jgi:hypothetical protein
MEILPQHIGFSSRPAYLVGGEAFDALLFTTYSLDVEIYTLISR